MAPGTGWAGTGAIAITTHLDDHIRLTCDHSGTGKQWKRIADPVPYA